MNTVRKKIDEIPSMRQERVEELRLLSNENIDLSDIPEQEVNQAVQDLEKLK